MADNTSKKKIEKAIVMISKIQSCPDWDVVQILYFHNASQFIWDFVEYNYYKIIFSCCVNLLTAAFIMDLDILDSFLGTIKMYTAGMQIPNPAF